MFVDEIADYYGAPDGVFDISNLSDAAHAAMLYFAAVDSMAMPFKRTLFVDRYDNHTIGVLVVTDKDDDSRLYLHYFLRKNGQAHEFMVAGIVLDDAKRYLRPMLKNDEMRERFYSAGVTEDLINYHPGILETALNFSLAMSLNLLGCKNVETVEVEVPKAMRKARAKKGKVAIDKTYVLAIEPTKKKYVSASDNAAAVGGTAFHICRGHFAEYGTEGRGLLFGKHAGRFWIQSHARGSLAAGKIEKTYKVNPPAANGCAQDL